ncbi:MAG: glycosyltransferase family 39 protein [Candidatus Omnitrophota bacterium]
MSKLNKITVLIIAVFAGCVLSVLHKTGGLLFFAALTGGLIFFMLRKAPAADRRFLIWMVAAVFVTRAALGVAVMAARNNELTQDEGLYSKKALAETCAFKGYKDMEEMIGGYLNDEDLLNVSYGHNGYTFVLACFYRVFGYQIQTARLISVFFFIVTFVLIYFLVRDSFGRAPARIASFVLAFLPSLALWSVMIGIDMMVLLGVTGYVFAFSRLMKKRSVVWALMMLASLLTVGAVRKYVMAILIAVTAVIFFIRLVSGLNVKARAVLGIVIVLSGLLLAVSPLAPSVKKPFNDRMKIMIMRQRDFVRADDAGYAVYPEKCYETGRCGPADFVKAYTKGMAYVLFSPFPWSIESKLQLMAYPQVVFFYLIFPFIVYGVMAGWKADRDTTLLVFLYILAVCSMLALVEGNVGSLFRHRDMVTPFFIVFFGVGFCAALRRARSGK